MKWVFFCEQYGLPPIAPSRQKSKQKHDKVHRDYKTAKRSFVKPEVYYAKKKNVKHDK